MTYIKASVRRAPGNPGTGLKVRDALVLYDVDDILVFPARNGGGVLIEEDIVMRPGTYPVCIYMTPGTAALTSAADGDTDAVGFTPQVEFSHPGNELEVREFKANWINKRCIAVLRHCNGEGADLIGSPCNPCKVTPSYTGNNESNANTFTVAQISRGDDIAIYNGAIAAEEPVSVVEAGTTEVEYVADGQYQLSAGAAEITAIKGGHHGAVITLLGTAGAAPTVSGGGRLMLRGGKEFTATEGSQLTLRGFDLGGGETGWYETSRHEAV